jgi:O-acetyl-ADP-ribose deacetylase (regulator of RNase III)
MITELSNTDALEIDCDAIAHGVNMQGAMAGGIAWQIAQTFPEAEAEYIWNCKWDLVNLGGCLPVGINEYKETGPYTLFNLFTQIQPGADARLDALELSLENMLKEASLLGIKEIAMPRIGCGIGGLEWDDVRPILLKASEGYNFLVCTL